MPGIIKFVTLFLSLVTGMQPVTVAVGGDVARVELRLDGELLGTLEGEPWTLKCDLGEELAPHVLMAVGFDARGREIASAKQLINLPRPRAEARLLLHDDEEGPPSRAQLTWDTVEDLHPQSIQVTFDDRPLTFDDPGDIRLPRYDPHQPHFLSAELNFGDDLEARTTTSFGGQVGMTLSTELTAVPITGGRPKSTPPSIREMDGWFHSQDSNLTVFAVEKTPADVLMVVDQDAWELLHAVPGLKRSPRADLYEPLPAIALPPGLRKKDRFRFVATTPEARPGPTRQKLLFPIGKDLNASKKKASIATTVLRAAPPAVRPQQYLADAVAVAGRTAAEGERPRAIILIVAEGSRDVSKPSPQSVRGYLEKLRIPLHVWYVSEPSDSSPWGEGTFLEDYGAMKDALKTLRRDLDSQHIVWLEGSHLPQNVELRQDGWRIAG